MCIAQLSAGVFKWSSRQRGEPQGSEPLEARQPPGVRHGMPLVQLGVRLDDLWVLQESVAEVVHYGGNSKDATQTFIKSRFCHDFVLPWVCVLGRVSSNRYASREPTISGIQDLRNLF